MIYDPTLEFYREKAKVRLKYFFDKGLKFELKEKRFNRTLKQNKYLHLILGWFAWEYGETMEYIKQEVFKKVVNAEIFKSEYVNKKTGEIRDSWRSTAELDSKEMTIAIDRFRDYASKEAGIYLPQPDDLIHLNEIEIELNNHAKNYI
ncbi:MAG: hypothetical protein KGV59_06195 [Tenacibaculum sp.]|nr:hypothetical protein [Tenacibaculum sp.]